MQSKKSPATNQRTDFCQKCRSIDGKMEANRFAEDVLLTCESAWFLVLDL